MTALRAGAAVLLILACTTGIAASPGAAATTSSAGSTVGSAGAGDPYFPRQGNGGYDVSHYALQVRYDPATKHLEGVATITARATQPLTRFDLDLRDTLTATSVTVDGRPAAHRQEQVQELVITPKRLLTRGAQFTVVVHYGGTPHYVTDPDGSKDGFITTSQYAFVASEPQGSPSWFPVNDTPKDKASYDVDITVPHGLTAVSNGQPVGHRTAGSWTTWHWRLPTPVSSYLVTLAIGHFDVTTGRTPGGIPYYTAVAPSEEAKAKPVLGTLPAIVDYFSRVYGRYPFGWAGAIVVDDPSLGYDLETATRPIFAAAPDVGTLAHELGHEWYGDDVTLAQWRDIWLNEGFAEFSSWLWLAHTGGPTLRAELTKLLAKPATDSDAWLPPPGNPGSGRDVFADSEYERGPGVLEALREKIGSHAFYAIMRGWLTAHRYSTATVAQFTAFAQRTAHRDLTGFFRTWLYKAAKPGS